MDTKTLLPLYSTIIGGLIAILGGLIVNYILQKSTKVNDKKKLIREKMEEAYLLTVRLEKWLQHQMGNICTITSPSQQKIAEVENPAHHIEMLIKCYGGKKCKKTMDKLIDSLESFRDASFNFYKEAHEKKKKPSDEIFMAVSTPFGDIQKLIVEVREDIQMVIENNY